MNPQQSSLLCRCLPYIAQTHVQNVIWEQKEEKFSLWNIQQITRLLCSQEEMHKMRYGLTWYQQILSFLSSWSILSHSHDFWKLFSHWLFQMIALICAVNVNCLWLIEHRFYPFKYIFLWYIYLWTSNAIYCNIFYILLCWKSMNILTVVSSNMEFIIDLLRHPYNFLNATYTKWQTLSLMMCILKKKTNLYWMNCLSISVFSRKQHFIVINL